MCNRDLLIAEAVRDAIADACDNAAREWLAHGFPAEKYAAVACAGIANRIDLPAIIASVGGDAEPVNKRLLDALKTAKWIIDMYAAAAWDMNGNKKHKLNIESAIAAAEKEMGKC